jgi:pyruvate/2-oxoglutarate dehydrogenase complex dihydrolipoamide acyltransferase (E2) component
MARNDTLAEDLLPWHAGNAGDLLVRPGDPVAARQWLAVAIVDDAQGAALRQCAHALSDGVDFSRLDEHQAHDHLTAALTQGRLFAGTAARPAMRHLSVAASPAPAPAPPPAAAPARAAPAEPPPAVETTFGSDVDVELMVAALQQAAQDGVAFCEECARQAAEATA